MSRSTRSTHAVAAGLAVALAVFGITGCGSSDEGSSDEPSSTTTTTAPTSTTTGDAATLACRGGGTDGEALTVVLVSDDATSPETDVVIETLKSGEINLDITVMSPSKEASGTSDSISPSRIDYTETTTPGGNEAILVDGFPADAVIVALTQLDLHPHLVIAGVNHGHNFASLASISSTTGIGLTAVRRDVPALTLSTGLEVDDELLQTVAGIGLDWITENCDDIATREFQTDTVTSINVPACPPDSLGELVEVPRAEELPERPGKNVFESDCDLANPDPATDVEAVVAGYPALTHVEPDL